MMSTLTIVGFALLFFYGVLGYKKPGIAFVTAPFAAVALAYLAVDSEFEVAVLLAPVVFLVAIGSVAVSAYGSTAREWYHQAAFLLLIWLILILAVAGILAWSQELDASEVLPLLFLAGVVVIILSSLSYGAMSYRVAVMNVFSTIGASMRQNLPLPMALDCASHGRYDATASILRGIKTWMVKGYSLSEAISRGYPQCPSWVLALLSAGERTDQLPAVVRAVEADLKSRETERTRLRPVHPAYPVIMLIILGLVTAYLLRYVVPMFKGILEEMAGGELPVATRMLIRLAEPIAASEWPLLMLLAAMVVSALWICGAWRRRRPERPYLLSQFGDALKWRLPILHWFQRNRAMVQVVELLRISLSAGCPVNEAIRATLQLDVNLRFRRRLACWLQRVERGEAIGESARRCGLGHALAWAFDGGAETGNTPAVLEMLEAHYRSNYSYRVNLARFILWPMGIIMLGVTVGFVIFAIFSAFVAALSQIIANVYP
jgi:type II secretory pathway component PulF